VLSTEIPEAASVPSAGKDALASDAATTWLDVTELSPRMPSDYLPGHTYFIQGAMDGPGDTEFAGEWFGFTGKDDMVMYGSSYPHWQLNELKAPASYTDEQRDKLCWRNAAQLYGIDVGAGVSAQ